MTSKTPKIDKMKLDYGFTTTEEMFEISGSIEYQCPNIDAATSSAKKINSLTTFSRGDDTEDNELLLDRLTDIEWESSDLPDNIEELRDTITAVREWGQDWKSFAKKLVEDNDVDLSDYL